MYHVQTIGDLYALQGKSGLDTVQVDLSKLKHRGLSHHAMRLAYFAVRQGGQIVLKDATASKEQSIGPLLIGWPTLRSLAIKALGRECQPLPDATLGEMRFERTAPALEPGWSAGIIFSGNDGELPALYRCLDGLVAQPELTGDTGEILVCGPTRDMGFLSDYPMVRYEAFDLEFSGPFPISRKKNALMRSMRYPRRLVLHARIQMQPGALAAAPAEFDILAPNVLTRSDKGEEANIGFITIDPGWPNRTPRRFERSTLTTLPERYLELLASGKAYVDGGAFAVSRQVFAACPLDDGLLWGDCEDVEWCFRAQSLGFLVDMVPGMKAVNTNSKVQTFETSPRFMAHGLRSVRRIQRGLNNLVSRARSGV